MYGMKADKKLAPMKQTKGSGLGRRGYSAKLQSRPKSMGAQPIQPATLRLKTSKTAEKILVPKQETKSLGY
jgi:hypothetical protein